MVNDKQMRPGEVIVWPQDEIMNPFAVKYPYASYEENCLLDSLLI